MELKRYEFEMKYNLGYFVEVELTTFGIDDRDYAIHISRMLKSGNGSTRHLSGTLLKRFTDLTTAENWFDRLVEMLKEE